MDERRKDMVQYLISTSALLVCTVTDLRFKKISRAVAAVYFILLLSAHFLLLRGSPPAELLIWAACGAIPGLLSLLLAKLTNEAIGYGDGVLILLLGCSLGFWACLSALLLAFMLAGFFGAIWLIIKKGTGKTKIAFVPFLLLGVLLQGLLQYAGQAAVYG